MKHSPQNSRGKYPRAGLTIQSRTKKLFIKRPIMNKTFHRQQPIQSFMLQWLITLQPKAKSIASTIKMFWGSCRWTHRHTPLFGMLLLSPTEKKTLDVRHDCCLPAVHNNMSTASLKMRPKSTTTTTTIYLFVQPEVYSTTTRSSIQDHPPSGSN